MSLGYQEQKEVNEAGQGSRERVVGDEASEVMWGRGRERH